MRGALRTRASHAEQILEAREPAEVAHEDLDRVAEVEVLRARAALHALLAVAVVQRALLRIAQHLVRLRHLLEPLLGFLRALVAIRMVLQRELPIGLLDLVGFGTARDAQQLVVISHRTSRRSASERLTSRREHS